MPALGDFTYVQWDISTQYGRAATVTGQEYTAQLGAIVAAGFGKFIPKPINWVPAYGAASGVDAQPALGYTRLPDLITRRAGNRKTIMAIGDSLSGAVSQYDPVNGLDVHANNSGFNLGHSQADWLFQANLINDSAMDVLGAAATGGFTIQQITDVHLPVVLAAKPSYCVCWTMVGNDILGSGDVPEETFIKFRALLLALEEGGVTPILMTMVPCVGVSGATGLEVERYNNFVARIATLRGYPLIDVYSVLVNPATGLFKAGYSDDNIHLNAVGSAALAPTIAAALAKLADAPTYAPFTFNVPSSPAIMPDGLIVPTPGDTTTPLNWFVSGGTKAIGSQAGVAGNVFSLTRDTANQVAFAPSIDVAEGDIWDLAFKLKTTIPAGGWWGMGIVNQDVAFTICTVYQQFMSTGGFKRLHFRGRIPAGTTKMLLNLNVNGVAGAKIEVGEIAFRNLSRYQIPIS